MTDADLIAPTQRVAAIFDRWSRPDHVRLHAGEMTAQEMRSVQAVLGAVRREVEAATANVDEEMVGPIRTRVMRAWPADEERKPDAAAIACALDVHDALPDRFRPSDGEPLRNCLPGIWPTVGDLRALLAQTRHDGEPSR